MYKFCLQFVKVFSFNENEKSLKEIEKILYFTMHINETIKMINIVASCFDKFGQLKTRHNAPL